MAIVLVLLLSAVSFVSSKGYRIAATLFAIDLGAGPLQTGILFALWGLFPFLLSIYAGRLADRFDNRLLMYYGLAGFTVSLALPAVFPALAVLYLSAALGGFTSMLFVVAAQNMVGVLSSAETRTRYFSYYALAESSAAIAGPVMVGLSIDAFRYPATFLLLALINAACLVILYARRNQIPNTVKQGEKPPARNARDLLALPALRNALLANGVVMAGLDLFNLYMPMYTHGLGFSATTIGLIMGAFGVAAFVTRLAIPPVTARWGEHAMIAGALALSAVAFIAVPLTHHPVLLGVASFVLGLGLGCGQPLSMILAFNAAPPGRSAEAIAMRLAVSYGAHIVIPPVFGAVGAAMGLAPIFWTCAVLLGGGSVLTRPKKS
ncbi:MAG TPA: MFS transporter [Burkholderiales bacterium]|jgi:MFS family permease|nr:MFS transporter [Burkholderiales bacterium]